MSTWTYISLIGKIDTIYISKFKIMYLFRRRAVRFRKLPSLDVIQPNIFSFTVSERTAASNKDRPADGKWKLSIMNIASSFSFSSSSSSSSSSFTLKHTYSDT